MKRSKLIATVVMAMIVLVGLMPVAGAARDRKAPKIKRAVMKDRNGNGVADRLVLKYNERVKHKRDADGKYPFKVTGWQIRQVKAVRKKAKLVIVLKENADAPVAPDVTYKKTRKKPVKDVAGNQARGQLFLKTIGVPVETLGEFTLNVAPDGPGTVSSSPEGIDCGTSCSKTFEEGTQVTLTAAPDQDGSFANWSGDCTGEATTCVITMDADKTVNAVFTAAGEAVLAVSKVGQGKISSVPSGIDCGATCSHTYTTGDQVTLTAIADGGGPKFVGWSGGTCSGANTTCTVTMNGNKTVTATFTWQLNASRTGPGSVTSSPAGINCSAAQGSTCVAHYNPNTPVTLTATPDAGGATFKGWTGDCSGTTTTCSVTMNEIKDVGADFEPPAGADPVLTVTVIGTGNVQSNPAGINCGVGGGTSPCESPFGKDSTVTLVALPVAPATMVTWTGCTTPSALSCDVLMDASKGVTANFTTGGGGGGGTEQTMTVSKSGTGSGTVSSLDGGINCGATCSAPYTQGASVALTAVPDLGSTFGGWSGACSGLLPTCNVTMDAAKNVTATFSLLGPVIKTRFF